MIKTSSSDFSTLKWLSLIKNYSLKVFVWWIIVKFIYINTFGSYTYYYSYIIYFQWLNITIYLNYLQHIKVNLIVYILSRFVLGYFDRNEHLSISLLLFRCVTLIAVAVANMATSMSQSFVVLSNRLWAVMEKAYLTLTVCTASFCQAATLPWF